MDISQLSKRQLIAQMLCFAFLGTDYDDQLETFVHDFELGGIIYFARNIKNPKQASMLNARLQKESNIPLFIGIDQEGGMVQRIIKGITPLPSAMALAASKPECIYEITKSVAQNLTCMGFNLNFAPVGDVNNNINNPVINSRSYSDDPFMVAKYASFAFKGFQDGGMLPTIKHFPGHGNTNVDSHIGLPRVTSSKDEVRKTELIPFKQAIDEGIDGVMVSHIIYEAFDQQYPSTLSKAIITDLLKKELGFQGLIVTDSLTMGAIHNHFSLDQVLEHAVNAGIDLLIFCGKADLEEQRLILNRLEYLVDSGKISLERIKESVCKILKLKEKYVQREHDLSELVIHSELSQDLYEHAVTKVFHQRWFPLQTSDNALILFPEIKLASLVDNDDETYVSLGSYLKEDEIIYHFSLDNLSLIKEQMKNYGKIILCTYNVTNNDFQTKLYDELPKEKTLVIALRSPYDLNHLHGVKNYVCLYELTPQSLQACAKALRGEISFQTKVPVNLMR
ncbi:MAG: beta-N-acetylhexosaminidase [Bacilli bacterium]|nr:beta-N-acetylhexosaminidase [Bacilli bacterium]